MTEEPAVREPVWLARFDGGYEARVYEVGAYRQDGRLFVVGPGGYVLLSEPVSLDPPDRVSVWEEMTMLTISIYEFERS